MNNLPDDVKFLIKGVIYLFLFLVVLNVLVHTAKADDTDGFMNYGQCMRIEKTHGNPCVHQAKTFISVGIGSNTGNGFSNSFFGHDINYFAGKRKTRYATDGTPSQCANPCQACKGGQCKYVCKEHVCRWVAEDHGVQSRPLSKTSHEGKGRGRKGYRASSSISDL